MKTRKTDIIGKRLLRLMQEKHTNLSLAADLPSGKDVLAMAKLIGDKIAVLKTHCDATEDFFRYTGELRNVAKDKGFMILEDRKFGDIGEISKRQLSLITNWADFVTAHAIAGEGTIEALGKGVILVAEMTQKGSMAKGAYTREALRIGMRKNVTGFVLSPKKNHGIPKKFVVFSPGVNFSQKDDKFGQSYVSPSKAIDNGSDIIIVGRGIYNSSNPLKTAEVYRKIAWDAYLRRSDFE